MLNIVKCKALLPRKIEMNTLSLSEVTSSRIHEKDYSWNNRNLPASYRLRILDFNGSWPVRQSGDCLAGRGIPQPLL